MYPSSEAPSATNQCLHGTSHDRLVAETSSPFEYEEVGPKIPNYVPSNKWGERGENLTKMQKPLPVAESMKHYVTPQKFHLELFMTEPEIQGKPIAMNWDHRGRLWLCETIDYPNELKDAHRRPRPHSHL